MKTELKKLIVDYMFENIYQFQIVNSATYQFRQYIYTDQGEYCIGGKEVKEFIENVDKLIN